MSNGDIHSFHFAFIVHAHREHCSPPSTFVPSKIENKRRLDKVRGEWHSNVLTKSHDFQFARTMCISHFTYCTMNMTWGIALLCNRTNRNHWRASIHDYARALFFFSFKMHESQQLQATSQAFEKSDSDEYIRKDLHWCISISYESFPFLVKK